MRKKRSRTLRLILIIVGIIVLCEVVARLIGAPILPPTSTFVEAQDWRYADWIVKDAEQFWSYRPSRVIDGDFLRPGRYSINAEGFRGRDYQIEKPDGVTRVVCLGESTTFGLGVSDDAAWPRQMERKLNALDPQKRQWEVLNLGVANYSTFQGVRLARKELPRLNPDFVMLCYSWADEQPAANGVPDDRIDLGSSWQIELENVLNRSAFVRWKRALWAKIVPPAKPAQAAPGFDQRRVPSTDYSENIERLAREALAVGARPVTVTSPIAWPPEGLTDTSGVFHIHHRYRRLSRFGAIAGGGEFVELANAFDQHRDFYDDAKSEIQLFNAKGHEFAGEFLARYLLGDSTIIARYGSQMYLEGR